MPEPSTLALLLVGAAIVLFTSNLLRHDIVAMIILGATALLDLVPASRVFDGFGHPAVITVAAVLILSAGLQRAGVIQALAGHISPFTGSRLGHLLLLLGLCALASAFMNNVGALALLIPVAIATAIEKQRSPALLLLPLAFASLLGGMTTLIGTPPNLIVSGFRERALGEPFAMFDFAHVGLPVAAAGLCFLVLLGWRLIPRERLTKSASEKLFEIDDYVFEVVIGEKSPLADAPLKEFPGFDDGRVQILGIRRRDQPIAPFRYQRLHAGDILLLEADPSVLEGAIASKAISIAEGDRPVRLDEYDWQDVQLAEAIVQPTSPLVGTRLDAFSARMREGAIVIAVARSGRVIRTKLRELRLAPGDILLVQGEKDSITRLFQRQGLLPLRERGFTLTVQKNMLIAVGIVAAAIGAAALGWLSTPVAFALACIGFVVARILSADELYSGVDWSVVVLLGAMFPLGYALEDTGASGIVAEQLLALAQGWPAWLVLALFLVVTMLMSDVVNNAATALLMAPIALSTAERLGSSPDAFLMAVAIGASCAFLTPIGHQSNTLVLGPGGYRFSDYWRVGLPLEIVITVVSVPLIVWAWGI